jgi:hypothetical protein
MQIQIYRSFSCNNSSDFRIVARFKDPKVAHYAASELARLFKEHAREGDASLDEHFASGGEYPPEKPTEACASFGKKHGFAWKSWLHWGDDSLEGDEPAAIASDDGTVVVHHTYCGGFPGELKKFFNAIGAAKVEREDRHSPTVSALFALPSGPTGKRLATSLTKIFEQANDPKNEYIDNWKIKPPWASGDQADDDSTNTSYFCDGKTFGFFIPMEAEHFDALKKYLAKNGVKNPSLRLCEQADLKKMKAIGAARCDACGGDTPLEYIDPRIHDIEAEQLACGKCGGMYDLATALKKKPKKPAKKAAEKAAKKKSATVKAIKKKAGAKTRAKTRAKTGAKTQ